MKSITLYRASSTNGGAFADAGTTLVLGDGPDQIGADRAQALVDTGGGASGTAAAKAEAAAPVEPVAADPPAPAADDAAPAPTPKK